MPIHAVVKVTAVSTTESTVSDIIVLNQYSVPFNVGFGVLVEGAGDVGAFSVQHTFDVDITAGSVWFDHSDVSGKSVNIDGNYAFPVHAVRIINTSGSGQGIATLKVMQAGL